MGGSGGEPHFVGKQPNHNPERQCNDELADELGFFIQTQIPVFDQFNVVVGKAKATQ